MPLATSTCRYVSPSLLTLPSRPPAVTTSSPLASASIIALCSFWRFICGRIITKYSTTNINTSGNRLSRLESVPAAGAAWAYALEISTDRSSNDSDGGLAIRTRIVCVAPRSAGALRAACRGTLEGRGNEGPRCCRGTQPHRCRIQALPGMAHSRGGKRNAGLRAGVILCAAHAACILVAGARFELATFGL